jgi:hypothetical protein
MSPDDPVREFAYNVIGYAVQHIINPAFHTGNGKTYIRIGWYIEAVPKLQFWSSNL